MTVCVRISEVWFERLPWRYQSIDALGYGMSPAHEGDSPTFEFVPTGIPVGDNVSELKVNVSDFPSAKKDFHLTLVTSGATENSNPTEWKDLGSWGDIPTGITVVRASTQ